MRTLNVEDPEAYRLAAAIAEETGETVTGAVIEALRQRFERLPGHTNKASLEELRTIALRAAADVKAPYLDHSELLYDENGLPR